MRKATPSDFDVLSDIYYRSVDKLLRDFCTQQQIDYYLTFERDADEPRK